MMRGIPLQACQFLQRLACSRPAAADLAREVADRMAEHVITNFCHPRYRGRSSSYRDIERGITRTYVHMVGAKAVCHQGRIFMDDFGTGTSLHQQPAGL